MAVKLQQEVVKKNENIKTRDGWLPKTTNLGKSNAVKGIVRQRTLVPQNPIASMRILCDLF